MNPRSLASIVSMIALLPCFTGTAAGRNLPQKASPPQRVDSVRAATDSASERAALHRLVSVALDQVSLEKALETLARTGGLQLTYSPDVVPVDRTVSGKYEDARIATVFDDLLRGTGLAVRVTRAGQVLLVRQALARQDTIAGRVTDAQTGQGLAGVDVRVLGRDGGTLTDDAGLFRIEDIPPGTYTVTASRIGYADARGSVTVAGNGVVNIDFALEPSAVGLNGIVVTATGPQRRREIGNAIGTIEAPAVVQHAPIRNFEELLMARVSGMQIIPFTGATGMSSRIRIRGLSSISLSRDPLLVVDGVRVGNTPSTGSNPLVAGDAGFRYTSGGTNDINPAEIESVEIVKGPSAATLYGTDAANGVILITTKRGRPGEARWNFYTEAGLLEPSVDFENNYFSWGTDSVTGAAQRCTLRDSVTGACSVDSLTAFNPLNHPETTAIGTGYRWQMGTQVSGGAERLTYFLSGEYERETHYLRMPDSEVDRLRQERQTDAIPSEQIRPNALRRFAFRANATVPVGLNANLTFSNGLSSTQARLPLRAIWYTYVSALWSPGHRDEVYDGWAPRYGRPGDLFAEEAAEDVTHYTGSVRGDWQLAPWLATRATIGLDFTDSYFSGIKRRGQGVNNQDGERLHNRTNTTLITGDMGASASFDITPRLASRTSVGGQYNRRLDRVTLVRATGLAPGAETVDGAEQLVSQEGIAEEVVAGAYLEQTFSLNDRLYLAGALRVDGGSSFGRNFQAAVYPKASLSWLVSEEPSMPAVPWLSTLRLRLAYGASGVQPKSTYPLTLLTRFTSLTDGARGNGAALATLGNADLKPERSTELEVGFDAELLSNRITLEGTYYSRASSDALLQRPLPASVGLQTQWVNVASVRNWGVEGSVSVRAIENPAFSLDLSVNGSINRNHLEELGLPDVDYLGGSLAQSREGYPIFSRWARPILDYGDANGNRIIETDEVQVGDTAVYYGPSHPPHQLSGAATLTALDGQVRLSTLFDYRGGHIGYNSGRDTACNEFSVCREVNDPSAPLWNQARAVARSTYGAVGGYFEDASFLRWRELAITYRPASSLTALLPGVRDLTITISGRNLLLWSGFSYPDPETNNQVGDDGVEGNLSGTTMPQTRYWTLRLNVGM